MAKKNRKQKNKSKRAPQRPVLSNLPPTRHKEVASAIELAGKMLANGQYDQAIALCNQVLAIEPSNALLHLTLADAHTHTGDINAATNAFLTAFKLAPNYLPAMINYAIMLYEAGLLEKSNNAYKAILAISPDFLPALDGSVQVLEDLRRYNQTIPLYEKLTRLRGSKGDYVGYCQALDMADQTNLAIKVCQRAMVKTADQATFETLAGMFESARGNKNKAIGHFHAAIDQGSCFSYLNMAKTAPQELDLGKIEQEIQNTQSQSIANTRAPLMFAKAVALEKNQKFDEAFDAFKQANDLVCSITDNDNVGRAMMAHNAQNLITPEKIAKLHAEKSDQSARPVFVTGLPRSGTTLVERIIASHSLAEGLGELELVPMLVQSFGGSTAPVDFVSAAKSYRAVYPSELQNISKFVDKSISSVLYVGHILAMFPRAKIIICQRHPMDVAWSAYKEYFNQGALAYTYSFDRIAEHQKIYSENIKVWAEKFPENIQLVKYETLVGEPEKTAKALISHIDLAWEDACLEFYKSSSAVRTASQIQVRQPIHTSSIGKWKKYEDQLGELKSLLSDEISAYEKG